MAPSPIVQSLVKYFLTGQKIYLHYQKNLLGVDNHRGMLMPMSPDYYLVDAQLVDKMGRTYHL